MSEQGNKPSKTAKKARGYQRGMIAAFLGVLVLPWLLWALLFLFSRERYDALRYDEQVENREIAQISDGFEAYFNDRVPFRSVLIGTYQGASNRLSAWYRKNLEPVLSAALGRSGEDGTVAEIDLGDNSIFQPGAKSENGAQGEKENPSGDSSGDFSGEPSGGGAEEPPADNPSGETPTEEPVPEKPEHEYAAVQVVEPTYLSYGYTVYRCADCGDEYKDDFVPKLVDTSYVAPVTTGACLLGRFDWMFYIGDDGLSYYTGSNPLSEGVMAEWTNTLAALKEECDARGIRFAVLILPDKYQVYPEYMPSVTVLDEYKRVQRFVDYAAEHSDVPIAYPLAELKYGDRYYQTYFRYDSHWNQVGAFLGTQTLYRELDIPTTSLLDVPVEATGDTIWHDLMIMGGYNSEDFPPDSDYIVGYKTEVTLEGAPDHPGKTTNLQEIRSNGEFTEKFVMVGDSYRNLMAPYIAADFQDSWYLHRASLSQAPDSAAAKEIILGADILVLETVERYDVDMAESARIILRWMRENP